MQGLPIGVSSFEKIRERDSLYVDKTRQIYDLLTAGGNTFFLSRPRRFGKSLLCDTIRQLFLGKKELFKGLWIKDKWDFEARRHPVIYITMRETKSLVYKHQLSSILGSLVDSGEVLSIELDKNGFIV